MLTGSPNTKSESAKQRALRIPLRYTRSWDGVWKFKFWFSVLAVMVVGAYCGAMFYGVFSLREDLSPGRVILAHQSFEKDCDKCHIAGRPLGGTSTHLVSQLILPDEQDRLAADKKCKECHKQDGKEHHSIANSEHQLNCAVCHQEHLGVNHDAKLSLDQNCTHCHANIADHAATTTLKNVTAFWTEGGHPEFRSLAKDEGRIRFNHASHMLPGQDKQGSKSRMTKSLLKGELGGPYELISEGDVQDLVQLDCHSCHQPSMPQATGERHVSGETMAAIDYEKHCMACHGLGYDVMESKETAKSSQEAIDLVRRQMPHGLRVDEMKSILVGAVTESNQPENAKPLELDPQKPLVGRNFGKNLEGDIARLPSAILSNAEEQVGNYCIKCHEVEKVQGTKLVNVAPLPMDVANHVPNHWFKLGRFDHAEHQGLKDLECRSCHEVAKLRSGTPDRNVLAPFGDEPKSMIPSKEKCEVCHSPNAQPELQTSTIKVRTAARFDCAECHAFHDRMDVKVGSLKVDNTVANWLKTLSSPAEEAK